MIRRLLRSTSGNFAMIAALVAPIILGAAGGMVDYHTYRSISTTLQAAADSAALAAANEAKLQGWTVKIAQAVAENYVDTNLTTAGVTKGAYEVKVSVEKDDGRVTVSVLQTDFGYLLVGLVKQTPYITATATAQTVTSSGNICVVGLKKGGQATVALDGEAKVTARDCAVYSNSNNPKGLISTDNALIDAALICAAGGYQGSMRNFRPAPQADCPRIEDPLASRSAPAFGACDHNSFNRTDFNGRIYPGVYCGGLEIGGNSRVRLEGGVYVIKDGDLVINGTSDISGLDVGFYFTGGSVFNFARDASIDLEAPQAGAMAGLLFFEDRGGPKNRVHRISSNDARTLVGTIYLPNGRFIIDAQNEVADASEYTAIVAQTVEMSSSPNLVLNSDFDATDVPVPKGLAGDGHVRLVR